MNRTIKFRAKRIDNNKWTYGGLIQADDYCIIDQGNELYVERDYNFRGDTHFFQLSGVMCDEKTIGQFTGLLDKNGKEIYEGDIVRVYAKYGIFNIVVKWSNDSIAFMACYVDGEQSPFSWFTNLLVYELEVIGNVFDNPDLIKEE